jgi:hypothetical protein
MPKAMLGTSWVSSHHPPRMTSSAWGCVRLIGQHTGWQLRHQDHPRLDRHRPVLSTKRYGPGKSEHSSSRLWNGGEAASILPATVSFRLGRGDASSVDRCRPMARVIAPVARPNVAIVAPVDGEGMTRLTGINSNDDRSSL